MLCCLPFFCISSGAWIKLKLKVPHFSTYQIHVVFQFNPRLLRTGYLCTRPCSKLFLYVVAATAAALQGLPFVTATNGASVCTHVCACITSWTQPGRFQPTRLLIFRKHPRRRPSNSKPHIGSYISERRCSSFSTCGMTTELVSLSDEESERTRGVLDVDE